MTPRGGWSANADLFCFQKAVCTPSRATVLAAQRDLQVVRGHYQQFRSLSERMVREGMESEDARVKFAAVLAAADRGLTESQTYLRLATDSNPLVRQGARRALIALSADQINGPQWRKKKNSRPKHVDFGPPPCCTQEQATAAVKLWEAWWEEQTSLSTK